ncbi:uncharacterized protein LOC114852603 [Betta splendens]|uniref:Uncharacterized protein LOC114852603 n=1 Tax=Betta splendens TaxID=158456 RepID=A0A6P7M3Z3_BETSP|nr:uncharacterized protein LOC114852603 [Betta splendens]
MSALLFVLLLFWGTTPAALSDGAGSSLDCSSDFEKLISCCFNAQNCSEHTLTVGNISRDGENQCGFQESDVGLCCCSVQMLVGSHKATVWRGKEKVQSETISDTGSFKPRAPTIVSVDESNGNFQLKWRTNHHSNYVNMSLKANVTYYKKGSEEKVTKPAENVVVDHLKYYEIPGQDLEPSTTYVVSVRSYSDWSGRCSDSSQEVEFTTAASALAWRPATVTALSAAAVLVTAAAFGCYYRVRAKCSDAVARCPKPKLLDVLPETERGGLILKPPPNDFSLVSVDAAAPNGGYSRCYGGADVTAAVQDALRQALARAPEAPGGRSASGAHGPGAAGAHFDNMTYVSGPRPPATGRSVDDGTRVKPRVPSLMITDMSYQSNAKESSLESTQTPSHQPGKGPSRDPVTPAAHGHADAQRPRKRERDALPVNLWRNASSNRFPDQEDAESGAGLRRRSGENGAINALAMDRSRFLRFPPFVPLLVAAFMAADALPAVTNATGSTLDCTNDFEERVFCQFEAQNCIDHRLKIRSNSGYGERRGLFFQPCDAGRCCCSVVVGGEMLIQGDVLTASVWKDEEVVDVREMPVVDGFKPKAPTIVSVKESNGNFQLKWRTNHHSYYNDISLTANVTYYKKGSWEKVTKPAENVVVDHLKYYEIPGQDLEPSTTYVVSVRSYSDWSGRCSDSSQEVEFTTAVSPHMLLLALIVGLSAFAVMVTAIMFGCYVKLKDKWWDKAASPKVFLPQPSESQNHQLLKPKPPVLSSVDIVPCDQDDSTSWLQVLLTDTSAGSSQSSGISTGSSAVVYARTEPNVRVGVQNALSELFPHLSPVSPVAAWPLGGEPAPHGLEAVGASSGSSGLDNKTYSLVIPMAAGAEERALAGPEPAPCVPMFRPDEGDAVTHVPPAPPGLLIGLPLLGSTLIPTDMSYHQCRPGVQAYGEDSGLSSVSSGSASVAACDEDGASQNRALVCENNPCYAHTPAAAAPLVVNAYQAFQKVAAQPDGSTGRVPVGIPGFPQGQCLTGLHRPLIALTCSQIPVITSTGYQSV